MDVQELDFANEARNAERCRANLAASRLADRVAVPEILPDLTSTRVLTMEFIEVTHPLRDLVV